MKININNIAGPRNINCLKKALDSPSDLLSATLKSDISPKHKMINTINKTLKGEDFMALETSMLIVSQQYRS